MARALWSGAISFGLVNIPIEVYSSKDKPGLSFHMIDSSDNSPIGYKKINKSTGKEVPAKKIVKAFEYKKNNFVTITPEDFAAANPKAARTIDIEDFVSTDEIDLLMYEKPYYLAPGKNGNKGYMLLRRVLEETGKAAIAQFVMHSKQHLVALIPRGDYIILETLRYADEVKEVNEAEFFDHKELSKIKISPKELKMAEELVKSMTAEWKPEKYRSTYEADLKKLIDKKIAKGDTEEISEYEELARESTGKNVVDLMPLLQKSLAASGKPSKRLTTEAHKTASKKKSPKKVSAAKAQARPKKASSHSKHA